MILQQINPIQRIWDLVLDLIDYINMLWDWLSKPQELTILSWTIVSITPITVIGGIGLTLIITLWIIRG